MIDTTIPLRLQERPTYKGMAVPALVAWKEGIPDFRVTDMDAWHRITRNRLCSLCGQTLDKTLWFIGGDRSMQERVFFDPPTHRECAVYSFQVCPYLALTTSMYNTHKPIVPPDGMTLVKLENIGERPKLIGFAGTSDYQIGIMAEHAYVLQANPWTVPPVFFKDRHDAPKL